MPRKVERPHCDGTWTKARFYQFIRSALRQASVKWPPRAQAMRDGRRRYVGPNPRQKWEYQCARCGEWFPQKNIELDHVVPCGTLRDLDDLPEFVRRLLVEKHGFRRLCKIRAEDGTVTGCHKHVTTKARRNGKDQG